MADAAPTTGTLHDLAPCWSCKGPVSARAPFCHACGAIQPPRALDHFSRLNLPIAYDLVAATLEKQYFGMQRYFHPDRFAAKTSKERALSLQHATNLNQAYETLKSPLGRAEYLLGLRGRAVNGEATISDPKLLMEAMEWREELAEASDRAAIDAIIVRAKEVFDGKIAAIGTAFVQDDLDTVAKLATELRYFDKLIDEARRQRARLGAWSMQILEISEPGETPLPHAGEATLAVGIDLGTTNSLVAIARDNRPEVLRDLDGDGMLPSVVVYGAGGSAVVGTAARLALLDRPDAVVSSIKRLMGRSYEDIAAGEAVGGQLPFAMEPSADGRMVHVAVAGRKLTPVEISADILRALKARAEHALGRDVDRAVITVPAYFDDAARTATKDAARLAGLTVLRLVNEPTAAALAYGLDKGAEGLYAIYDLGGGTFDVSILKLEKGVFQVLATGGDHKLGGDDFDNAIVADVMHKVGHSAVSIAALKQAQALARDAKEWLSGHERGEWEFEIGGKKAKYQLDRPSFERLIDDLVTRTIRTASQVLDDARLTPVEIKGVVLVGGSTRVPLVRREVEQLFGRAPLADINPDEVVALGAALQAEALTVGSDTLLLDVTPLSLGIETMGGLVEKVIPRNTPIPAAAAQEFTTYQDGQSAMLIHVLQGERELVSQNRSLARFELHGIPPMTAGAARIRVTFAVDADGLLNVSAEERATGIVQSVEVKPSYGLSEEEMVRMLRDSMEHGQADMEARLLAEARVEAERVLLALRSALRLDGDLLSQAERDAIDKSVASVEKAVAAPGREAINAAVKLLDAATQDFAERRMDRGIRAALTGVSLDRLAGRLSGD